MSDESWTIRSRGWLILVWSAVALFASLSLGWLIAAPFVDKPLQNSLGASAFGAIAAFAFAHGRRTRLDVTREGVVVVSYLRTRTIPWSQLADASIGYGGAWLTLSDGTKVRVPSAGDSLFAALLKRRTPLDAQFGRLRDEIVRRNGHA